MSTSPQPMRPPIPPQPPRPSSNIVAIALLVLVLIVLVSGIAVWTGLKFLSHDLRLQVKGTGDGHKEVSINTPIGSIEVHHDVNQDSLGLPIYPGATQVKDKDSAAVDLGFGGEQSVRVLAAKFETSDSFERVKAFYKEHLGSEVTKFTDQGSEGKTTFEIKTHSLEKVVALEGSGSGTRIQLVRVSFGRNESN
ncbi:MAG: hypothetical protein ACLQVM_24155 [Terriglobia bacterium]